MRLIKMLGLAAIAALAAMAFVGASSASADTLCEQKLADTAECPAGSRAAIGSKIVGLSTNAVLLAPGLEPVLECNSETLGEITGNNGAHTSLSGTITKLLFTNCVGGCESAHGLNLPYNMKGVALSLHALVTAGPSGLKPGAELRNCFGVNCKYEIKEEPALLLAPNESDNLIADHIKLTRITRGFCVFLPSEGFWDATYLVTLDPKAGEHVTPLYLVSLP